ncbi:MAG TPA: hypothetical protein VMI92_02285 [Steroidobacteraceae bacterium]|nr:hypothetical protein [Steroidobacteraceae bacterium]
MAVAAETAVQQIEPAAQKLPDWSGVWALDLEGHEYAGVESGPNGTIERIDPNYASLYTPEQIAHLRTANKNIPFTPKWRKLWGTRRAGKENLASCLPAGVPGVMLHTIKMEFLFTPGRVSILTENGEVRRIHTDGRQHSTLSEIGYTYEGESIGHWEGDTLVVDTIGFPYGELFQNGALRGTRHTHYVERIHLRDQDNLQIDSTLDDPEIFTAPYKVTRNYERVNDPMAEPQCSQTTHDSGHSITLNAPPED